MKQKTKIVNREYLRAKEVAEELSVGVSTVWLYAKQGKITPIKMSERVTVFSIDDINNSIGSNIQKSIEVKILSKK